MGATPIDDADFSSLFPALPTRSEAVDKLTPLVGDGYLVQGNFGVWYEGKLFRDLLKPRANGDTDTSWRFDFSKQSGNLAYFDKAVVTPYGIAITGNFDRVDGVAVDGFAYVSLETGKLIRQPVFQTFLSLWPLTTRRAMSTCITGPLRWGAFLPEPGRPTCSGRRRLSGLTGFPPKWWPTARAACGIHHQRRDRIHNESC